MPILKQMYFNRINAILFIEINKYLIIPYTY